MNRKNHWEKIYAEKSPCDVSWFQTKPDMSMKLIERSGVAKDAAIIDVGGGASVLVDHLCTEGYSDLTILDISAKALAHSQERLCDTTECIEWIDADVTAFEPQKSFALWHDRAVFHFLTESSDRKKYVDVLTRGLAKGGQLIIAAFAIDGPTRCSGLDIVQYDEAKMSAELGERFTLLEEIIEVHVTPTGSEQKFQYFRYEFS